MKKFKIYGFSTTNQKILITNSESISLAATFDEEFKLQRYMKSDFNFKIADTLKSGIPNPFIGLVYPGGKIRLELPNKIIDFIITNMSSEFYKDMIVYNVSCQDYASYIYSKQGLGLSLDFTGTIDELTREVLSTTRKNIGYLNSNKNYIVLNSYYSYSNATVSNNILYTNYIGSSFLYFNGETISGGQEYKFKFYAKSGFPTGSIANFILYPTIYSADNQVIAKTITGGWNEVVFTANADTFRYSLRVDIINEGSVYLSDISINFNISNLSNLNYIENSLHLAGDSPQDTTFFNPENFRSALYENLTGDQSYFKKVTLSLSNSNLYNAFIEIAKLYNAEVKFNYDEKTINFINKDLELTYKGYRLSPYFNLLQLSREEDFSEFSSVLRISGADSLEIFPDMPVEYQQYLLDCLDNNFTGEEFFEDYNLTSYKDIAQNYVYNYISEDEDINIRKQAIDDFSSAADFAPHLENSLYSLDYYYQTNKITLETYNNFKNKINNDLRLYNLKLRLYNNLYYNNDTQISNLQNNIDFISKNMGVESINLFNYSQTYDYLTVTAGDISTDQWTVNKIIGGATTAAVPLIAFSGDDGIVPSYISAESTVYYGKYISASKIQLYEDAALTKLIDIPASTNNKWYLYRNINYLDSSARVLLGAYYAYKISINSLKEYQKELYDSYSITYDASLNPIAIEIVDQAPKIGTYTYYVLHNKGFINDNWQNIGVTSGIHQLILDLNKKINVIKNLNVERQNRINVLNTLLLDANLTSYQINMYEQEKAGLESLLELSKYDIGDSTTTPVIKGSYTYQLEALTAISIVLSNSVIQNFSYQYYIAPIVGLYDTIQILSFDKEEFLHNLYKDYENYLIEGYYENTEEITSSGLLEQALTLFIIYKYPKLSYGVSVIDISALQNYEYIDIDIWDKILIQEAESRLYKTYIADIKYLEVFEIAMSLRRPEETKLTVSQEDQVKRILQKILFKI